MRKYICDLMAAINFGAAGIFMCHDAHLMAAVFAFAGAVFQVLRDTTEYETHNVIHVPGKDTAE